MPSSRQNRKTAALTSTMSTATGTPLPRRAKWLTQQLSQTSVIFSSKTPIASGRKRISNATISPGRSSKRAGDTGESRGNMKTVCHRVRASIRQGACVYLSGRVRLSVRVRASAFEYLFESVRLFISTSRGVLHANSLQSSLRFFELI